MKTTAPIAFFAYNRPEHCRRALESLTANDGASESELFIFCDGPKGPRDDKEVAKVRSLVRSGDWCGTVHIFNRDENWGLAKSITHGVTEILSKHDRIIVLEDDLVLSPYFLNYMNDALEFYKNTQQVMHISGYMFPVKGPLPTTFFYRAASCWGWGTWKRAWDRFEPDPKLLLSGIMGKSLQHEFDIKGSMNYYKMLRDHANGRIDSWAIRWYASVFLNQGLCLHPGQSLTNNIGHDGTGIHCTTTNDFQVNLSQKNVHNFPAALQESEDVVQKMVEFYRSIHKPLPLMALRWLQRKFF